MSTTTSLRAADFLNAIGVEAKLNYTDGGYRSITNVLADINYLGIDLIRAAAPNKDGNLGGQNDYIKAANADIRFDFVVNGNKDLGSTVSQIANFATAHSGSVYAVEGPNEIDHQPITYAGLSGGTAAIAYQDDLYDAIESNSVLAGTNVYSFSLGSGATPTGGYTAVSLHPYPSSGKEPLSTLMGNLNLAPAGASSVVTETGYSTASTVPSGVDQITQAKLTLNVIFDAMKQGAQGVYLYELMDAYADPSGTNLLEHYGLFDNSNAPKLAATAIHNLTSILADSGSDSATFATQALDYTVTNASSADSNMEIQKSSGVYDIVFWAEPTIWNNSTHSEVTAPTTQEVLDLGNVIADVKIYDPLTGTIAISQASGVSQLTVGVSDHPVIIEVDPTGTRSVQSANPVGTTASTSAATNINGTSASETLNGTAGSDIISGLGGSDVIHAGGGDDIVIAAPGRSVVDGGDGFDTVSFGNADNGVKVNLGTTDYQKINSTIKLSLSSIERVIGSSYADTLTGGNGNDSLSGMGGDDKFIFSGGHDVIDGGDGTDTMTFADASAGVTISLKIATAQSFAAGSSVQLNSIENLTGSSFADNLVAANSGSVLSGGAGDDTLVGGAGNDQLIGGTGENTAVYALATAGVHVSLAARWQQDTGGGGIDTLTQIQDLIGSSHDDQLTGDSKANKINGGSGADVIVGGAGADTLTGGLGADSFVYTTVSDSTVTAADTIMDFSTSDGDKIDLSEIDANKKTPAHESFTIVSSLSKMAGQLAITPETGGYLFQGDVNGDGIADLVIHVHSLTALTAADIVL